jgi:glucose/arabinose dehydrogenase
MIKYKPYFTAILLCLIAILTPSCGLVPLSIGNIFIPAKEEVTEERVKNLKLPEGFVINIFAQGFEQPRMIKVSQEGRVYVTDRKKGEILMLTDSDRDGKADQQKVVAQKEDVHGITLHEGFLYAATVNDVYRAAIKEDGTIDQLQRIIDNLPEGGRHPNRTIAFGPDGMMYVSIGSTCNACQEERKEAAAILQAKPDGSGLKVYASGLRNTIGFDWHPSTKEMYGMDHGTDGIGNEEPGEELNKIREGANYGWPYIYNDNKPDPKVKLPDGVTLAQFARQATSPVITYTAHSAPMEMLFYSGNQFPNDYQHDAFIALHGSWNRNEPVGYKVVRLRFKDGKPVAFEDFLTGFLVKENKAQFGRVCGLAQYQDGSLLITDDENGVIYRVAFKGR